MTRTSAYRRHQQRRYDARARKILRSNGWGSDWHYIRHNRAVCSCHMFGNPWRFWKGNDRVAMHKRYHQHHNHD